MRKKHCCQSQALKMKNFESWHLIFESSDFLCESSDFVSQTPPPHPMYSLQYKPKYQVYTSYLILWLRIQMRPMPPALESPSATQNPKLSTLKNDLDFHVFRRTLATFSKAKSASTSKMLVDSETSEKSHQRKNSLHWATRLPHPPKMALNSLANLYNRAVGALSSRWLHCHSEFWLPCCSKSWRSLRQD